MTQAHKAITVFFVAACGLWGCAEGPAGRTATAERVKVLEAKNSKLEEDARAAVNARDLARKQAAAIEAQRLALQQELDQLNGMIKERNKEREDLRAELKSKTTEREMLQTQYDQFRRNIRELLGQAEASLPVPTPLQPVSAATTIVPGGKS